jgi:hypothetical protein
VSKPVGAPILGASDGRFISNTWNLIATHGWSAVLIEADGNNFSTLRARYEDRDDVHCLREFVSIENHPDKLLGSTPIPRRFDLLSIDIDGMDYRIWERIEEYRPRVVVIEVNCTMDTDIYFIQHEPTVKFGSSALAMVMLAKSKGYELVAHLVSNCVFVLAEDFPKLDISDNSLSSLFTSPFVPKVISDLNGVHHILKEGAWGFSGAVWSSHLRRREGGLPSGHRLEQLSSSSAGRTLATNPSEELGFVAAVAQNPELLSVTRDFIARSTEADAEFGKL